MILRTKHYKHSKKGGTWSRWKLAAATKNHDWNFETVEIKGNAIFFTPEAKGKKQTELNVREIEKVETIGEDVLSLR